MERPTAERDPWPWIGVASATAFIVLATIVSRSGGLAFDVPLATAIRGLPVPVRAWQLITALGGGLLVAVGVALVLACLLSGRLRLALIVALVLIGATLFTHVVKEFVERPRPPWPHLVPAPGYSFPSGHTLNSTVTYGLLAVVAWRARLAVLARRAAVAIAVTLPFLIGLSRIALGVHYPTDVLGGWLGGVAFVALGATLIRLTGAMERDVAGPWVGRPR
ncbi:MAG: phosphatase PAP2 family protein [Candidatus Limnocylindrales bacterium]|jgi:undecaprenyl-diphosphatase